MPSVVKVCENEPVLKIPESQTSGPVVASLVVEWDGASQFHVTVSPDATVTTDGVKAFEGPMLTVCVAAGAAADAAQRAAPARRMRESKVA